MPTKTFYNLDESKSKIIIDAAIKEFSRVGFDDSSIKNIVEEAKIPRGSFYQYFKDKEDLYLFVMYKIGNEKRKSFKKLLKENNGDIFASFKVIFQEEFKNYGDNTYHNLFKNFFSESKYSMREKINAKKYFDNKNVNHHHEVMMLINKDLYKVTDEDTLKMLMRTMFSSMQHMIMQAGHQHLSEEEVMKKFNKLIDLLKYGILKEK